MSSLSAKCDDIRVVIPQSLIERALKKSTDIVEEILPYDEGYPVEQPLSYEEEPRLFSLGRLILITAIVGSLLTFTGLQVADSHAPASSHQVAVASGTQTMSAMELVQSVNAENRNVYWLGSKQGDSYSNSSSADGVDQITYHPEGSDISNLNQFDLIVGTYHDSSIYDAHPHPYLGGNGRTITLTSGALVSYNASSPDQAVVRFPNKSQVVVLNYPAVQSVPNMINDAQNLVPIS